MFTQKRNEHKNKNKLTNEMVRKSTFVYVLVALFWFDWQTAHVLKYVYGYL